MTSLTQDTSLQAPAREVGFLVDRLVQETDGIVYALVLSTDGLKLAVSNGLDIAQADRFAAAASSVFSVSNVLGQGVLGGEYQKTIVGFDTGHVIVVALGNTAALATVTEKAAKLGSVAYEMSRFAARIGDLLTPEVRAELRGGPAV